MLHPNFVILGSIVAAFGSLSYLIDTVKGRVKPNRVSFFLWSVFPLIAFAAQISEGVGIQSLMTFSVGVLPLMIFIASFFNKKAKWKITSFDLICGLLSIGGLILWQITKVGSLAIGFSILADGLAAIPTITKAYKYPETENAWPWAAIAASGLFTLLTITNWNFAHFGFPLYILVVNFLIYFLVQFKLGKKWK